MGDPMQWYDAVLAAKQGIPENVVVLSLVNSAGGPCPPVAVVNDGVNLVDFTAMYGDNGVVGGICEADYGPFFAGAIGVIDVACENYLSPL